MAEQLDSGHTEIPVRYDQWDGTLPSLFATHRYYVVGKLVRQSDDQQRETLRCLCHNEMVKVFGPSVASLFYRAYCYSEDMPELLAVASTMEQLWITVTSLVEE